MSPELRHNVLYQELPRDEDNAKVIGSRDVHVGDHSLTVMHIALPRHLAPARTLAKGGRQDLAPFSQQLEIVLGGESVQRAVVSELADDRLENGTGLVRSSEG